MRPISYQILWSTAVCLVVCLSICLSVCMSVCVSVCLACQEEFATAIEVEYCCLPGCVYVCLSVCLSLCMSVYLCVSSLSGGIRQYWGGVLLSAWLCGCVSVCLYVCLSVCVCLACQEEFATIEVEYCCLPGWLCSTEHIRQFGDLPANAQAYVRKIEELTSVPGQQHLHCLSLSVCLSVCLFQSWQWVTVCNPWPITQLTHDPWPSPRPWHQSITTTYKSW